MTLTYFNYCFNNFSPGPRYGLSVILLLGQKNYIPFITESAGARIGLHPAGYVPYPLHNGKLSQCDIQLVMSLTLCLMVSCLDVTLG